MDKRILKGIFPNYKDERELNSSAEVEELIKDDTD
jgi:hypothetical protein